MPHVVIDTDVFSYDLKRDTRAELYRQHTEGRQLALSFVTLAELYAWANLHGWGPRLRARLDAMIAGCLVIWPDPDTCTLWADVTAACARKGRRIGQHDAWIAACALRLKIPVITHNRRHFESVPNLTIISEAPQ